MRVDMANRIELATTLFFVWKNSDPPPALLAGLGSVRVTFAPTKFVWISYIVELRDTFISMYIVVLHVIWGSAERYSAA